MGKYMKKGKITGDIAMMEIPTSTSTTTLGVRTRARTLALQPNPELSYLQLRSRRLEKPPPPPAQLKPKPSPNQNPNGGQYGHLSKVVVVGRRNNNNSNKNSVNDNNNNCYSGAEASYGENNLEYDSRERSTRESTPCSLISDSEAIGTPGSTTRPTCSSSANRRARNMQRAIPTTPEMEEFFAGFELHQQKLFLEKYNYDIMNDLPLPGRYEWVRVDN